MVAAARRVLLGLGLGALAAGHAPASTPRDLGLADMSERAGRIFVGVCRDRAAAPGPAGRLPVTTYRFEVRTAIRGVAEGSVVTVRVPGAPGLSHVPGLPVFEPGEEVLLLLYRESAAGFSAPMGLDQGAFRPAERGREVVNGRRNRGLLSDVPEPLLRARGLRAAGAGPLRLADLVSLLRALEPTPGRRSP